MTEPITLTTTDGDTIDEICHRHYGSTVPTTAVIEANPHLLAYPVKLPAGLSITLPVVEQTAQRHTRLW